jgi:hypothetical protein
MRKGWAPGTSSRATAGLSSTAHFKTTPDTRLNPKKATEGEFETTRREYRFTTSVGGTLTHLLVGDEAGTTVANFRNVARPRTGPFPGFRAAFQWSAGGEVAVALATRARKETPRFFCPLGKRPPATAMVTQRPCARRPPSGAVLDRRCARRPHHRAGRNGRMAPPGAEQKNDTKQEGKMPSDQIP